MQAQPFRPATYKSGDRRCTSSSSLRVVALAGEDAVTRGLLPARARYSKRGVQLAGGEVSTKPSGSKISASMLTPSTTRGPGRQK